MTLLMHVGSVFSSPCSTCLVITLSASPLSLCSNVSPTQTIGVSPLDCAKTALLSKHRGGRVRRERVSIHAIVWIPRGEDFRE